MNSLPDIFSEVKLVWRTGKLPPSIIEGRVILTDVEFTYCSNDGSKDLSATYNAIEQIVGGRLDGVLPVSPMGAVSPYQYVVELQFKNCHRWKFLLKSDADSAPSPTGLGGGGSALLTALSRRRLLRPGASAAAAAAVQTAYSAPTTTTTTTSTLSAASSSHQNGVGDSADHSGINSSNHHPHPLNSDDGGNATAATSTTTTLNGAGAASTSPLTATSPTTATTTPATVSVVVDVRTFATELLLMNNAYAFEFKLPFDVEENGWDVYNAEREYERMFENISPKYRWTISDVNKDYTVCGTYPAILCFPPAVDPAVVAPKSAEFRDGGRLPALAWVDPVTLASITRCSQPLPGRLGNRRSDEDELLIHSIFRANPDHPPNGGYILDARPYQNAMANRALGAGFEKSDLYMGCSIEFMNIDNIHVVRDSFDKMKRLNRQYLWSLNGAGTSLTGVPFTATCPIVPTTGQNQDVSPGALGGTLSLESSLSWLGRLADSCWIRHICSVLCGALRIAHLVRRQRASVVVHCSHGWDRTAQLVSLAQLLLDPYYRTLRGFQVLIEKDWVSFGHRFTDRCGHVSASASSSSLSGSSSSGASSSSSSNASGSSNISGSSNTGMGSSSGSSVQSPTGTPSKEEAPIFVQFLDCVWQLMQQFPMEFEFNELFLVTIIDQLYACKYGTFLANCERSIRFLRLRHTTTSLWSYINHSSVRSTFLNPLYHPIYTTNENSFLPASATPNNILFCYSLYNRCENDTAPFLLVLQKYNDLQQQYRALQASVLAAKQQHAGTSNPNEAQAAAGAAATQ